MHGFSPNRRQLRKQSSTGAKQLRSLRRVTGVLWQQPRRRSVTWSWSSACRERAHSRVQRTGSPERLVCGDEWVTVCLFTQGSCGGRERARVEGSRGSFA